jgi:type II secretory pathway component PulK
VALLRIFSDTMTDADAAVLAEARGEGGFDELGDFLDLPQLAGQAHVAAAAMAAVDSRFFAVRSITRFGDTAQTIESLIVRDPQAKITHVLRRSRYYL